MTLILLIDNFDSFTYNAKQILEELGETVVVKTTDEITIPEIDTLNPDAIVMSSGSGTPEKSTFIQEIILAYHNRIPLLGIGLAHLTIGHVFGAEIIPVTTIKHGKTSAITHNGSGPFSYLEQPLEVMRYHSFTIEPSSLPDEIEVIATALDDKDIMSIKHRDYPVYGFQFQPDSIGTKAGHKFFENFLSTIQKEV